MTIRYFTIQHSSQTQQYYLDAKCPVQTTASVSRRLEPTFEQAHFTPVLRATSTAQRVHTRSRNTDHI